MRIKIHSGFAYILSYLFSTPLLVKMQIYKNRRNKVFYFNDIALEYFDHSYNNSRIRERTIEIPIVKYYWQEFQPRNVLEVGNVTNHYYSYFADLPSFLDKTVVDLHEKASGVINEDIHNFQANSFDFIFSISTFEHVTDPLKAIKHVIDLLDENGTFILTTPLGYEPEYDKIVPEVIKLGNTVVFKRYRTIYWRQIPFPATWKLHRPAAYLMVLEFRKGTQKP